MDADIDTANREELERPVHRVPLAAAPDQQGTAAPFRRSYQEAQSSAEKAIRRGICWLRAVSITTRGKGDNYTVAGGVAGMAYLHSRPYQSCLLYTSPSPRD